MWHFIVIYLCLSSLKRMNCFTSFCFFLCRAYWGLRIFFSDRPQWKLFSAAHLCSLGSQDPLWPPHYWAIAYCLCLNSFPHVHVLSTQCPATSTTLSTRALRCSEPILRAPGGIMVEKVSTRLWSAPAPRTLTLGQVWKINGPPFPSLNWSQK